MTRSDADLDALVAACARKYGVEVASLCVRRRGAAPAEGSNLESPWLVAPVFRVGSISKPLAAATMLLAAAQHDIDLDTDINDLVGWRPDVAPGIADGTISLRRLLSHTAGLNVRGYLGYRVTEEAPTLAQIIHGDPPAAGERLAVVAEPGTTWSYSGGGYSVVQFVIEQVTGTSLAQLSRSLLFDPLGMASTWFGEPADAPPGGAERIVGGQVEGVALDGGWMQHPEGAAAGAWSTSRDLVALGSAITEALAGRGPLESWVARTLTEPSALFRGSGHGLLLDGLDPTAWAHHSGGTIGYQSLLILHLHAGVVAAVLTNDWPRGAPCCRALLREALLGVGELPGAVDP